MTTPRITVRRPVTVLARVTASLKAEMKAEIRSRLERLGLQLRQLDLQESRLAGQSSDHERKGMEQVLSEIEREREKRRNEIRQLLAREREVEQLDVGSEVRRGTVDAEAQVAVGDRWEDLLDWELVLEDGVVVEIRGGAGSS